MVMKSEFISVSVANLVEKQTVGSEWCALYQRCTKLLTFSSCCQVSSVSVIAGQSYSSISVLITKTTLLLLIWVVLFYSFYFPQIH